MSDNYQPIYDAISNNFDFSYTATRLIVAIEDVANSHQRPSVLFRPQLTLDGNQWIALYGENLTVGVAGHGDSPELAMVAFDKAWNQKIEKVQP